jgi:large subunit ribosomal protein L30
MLKITLVKSKIGNTPANRATIKALGLNKISSSNTFEDNAVVRGMIHKVKHLIKVEEIEGGTVTRRRQD